MMTVLGAAGHSSLFEEAIPKEQIKPAIFHALCTAFQFKMCQCVKNVERPAKHVHNKAV